MASHKFEIAVTDNSGALVGVQCCYCYEIVHYRDGKVPDDLWARVCRIKGDKRASDLADTPHIKDLA